MDWTLSVAQKPPEAGYYIAAWQDEGNWRVSELWFNPDSPGSGWWPSRGYMARFVGDAPPKEAKRSLTVGAWMPKPEFPGLGRIVAYKWTVPGMISAMAGAELILDPKDVTIIREKTPEI